MSSNGCCGSSNLPGLGALQPEKYIKVYNGQFVVIEGSEIIDRVDFSNTRFPYEQYFRSRMTLLKGAVGQVVNYANLGDNVTFLLFKVTYDSNATEEEKQITYYFEDEPSIKYCIGQGMMLTGNSECRVPRIVLDNPSTKYDVQIDMIVASIDNNPDFFAANSLLNADTTNITISNLLWDELVTHVTNQSIKVLNKSGQAQLYIQIADIANIVRQGRILLLDDNALGRVYLDFVNNYNAVQALSSLSWMLEDPANRDLPDPAGTDDTAPVVTLTSNVVAGVATIDTSVPPYDTYPITKNQLITYMIDDVNDNRDGTIIVGANDVTIKDSGTEIEEITALGTYEVTYDIQDIAENNTQIVITLNVI
jgi:hypothetical protein